MFQFNKRIEINFEEARKMSDKNYDYFESQFTSLYKEYKDKYIVIKDCNVIGNYSSFDDAYENTLKTEKLGTFLIQLCSNDEEKTVNYFYSNNVSFA